MNPPRKHDALPSIPPDADAGDDPPLPTLARWYRSTSRDPAERSQHLQAIAEAIVVGPVTTKESTTVAAAHAGTPDIQLAAARATTARSMSAWLRAAALIVIAAGGASLLALRGGDASLGADAGAGDALGRSVPTANGAHDVGFALRLTDGAVRQVSLAGDFNGWDASTLPMVRDPADGTWRVRIPLAPGRHTYSFVVDGTRWVIDPLAPRTVEGALGPANVIAVSGDS
jgi:hypothetical protein